MLAPKVWNLTLGMLSDKYLKAKAAETHGLLGFVMEILQKHKDSLVAGHTAEARTLFDLLSRAGEEALKFDAVLERHSRAINTEICTALFNHYNAFISLCARADVPILPKAHMVYHMVQRALRQGNPRMYSTYIDESYNGNIARVCRSVHRQTWALGVYRKLAMLESMKVEESQDTRDE